MPTSSLHVVILIYFYEPDLKTPGALLDRYSTIRPFAESLHKEGAEVTVLQRFHKPDRFSDKGVCYEFHADECEPNLPKWQIPRSFHLAVRNACARDPLMQTAVHVQGLLYPLQTRFLRRVLPHGCTVVAQHHAEKPWRSVRRPLQQWGLRRVDGFFFAARNLADSWIDEGLISQKQQIFEVMEGSTDFRWQERPLATSRTGFMGSPTILWVGNLTPNKDPLTVLAGFEQILEQVQDARLYMVFRGTDLLAAVSDRIRSSSSLSRKVTLLGSVDHQKLEDIYNSSDYFVLGSHYEGSGFALAEATACGVVPVVTAIPSFIKMTDNGRIGACWAPGDADAFRAAFLQVLRQPVQDVSNRARRFFDEQLSYPAIARASVRAYKEVIAKRAGPEK